jgi:membrane dipeptidase
VAAFHAIGLRMAQLSYNEASAAGDGCLEERGGGLTRFGRALVAEMNRVGIGVDVSHCSERVGVEAARAVAATGGVIGVSIHGFMNWDGDAAHPPTLASFVRQAQYVADLVGVDHVGIGTDFSAARDEASVRGILEMSKGSYPETGGAYAAAFGNTSAARYPRETPTPREFPRLLEALERGGFTRDEVARIGGGNFLRAFRAVWG